MQSSNKFAEHLFIYDVLPASWSDAPINLGNMHLYGASWLVIFWRVFKDEEWLPASSSTDQNWLRCIDGLTCPIICKVDRGQGYYVMHDQNWLQWIGGLTCSFVRGTEGKVITICSWQSHIVQESSAPHRDICVNCQCSSFWGWLSVKIATPRTERSTDTFMKPPGWSISWYVSLQEVKSCCETALVKPAERTISMNVTWEWLFTLVTNMLHEWWWCKKVSRNASCVPCITVRECCTAKMGSAYICRCTNTYLHLSSLARLFQTVLVGTARGEMYHCGFSPARQSVAQTSLRQ